MKLTLKERALLLSILPEKEEIGVLRIVRDLKHALSPSEEEFVEFGIVTQSDGAISWNVNGNEEREVSIGEKATDVCVQALNTANKAKALSVDFISLYDKFIRD
jgi:hypothetical protein